MLLIMLSILWIALTAPAAMMVMMLPILWISFGAACSNDAHDALDCLLSLLPRVAMTLMMLRIVCFLWCFPGAARGNDARALLDFLSAVCGNDAHDASDFFCFAFVPPSAIWRRMHQ